MTVCGHGIGLAPSMKAMQVALPVTDDKIWTTWCAERATPPFTPSGTHAVGRNGIGPASWAALFFPGFLLVHGHCFLPVFDHSGEHVGSWPFVSRYLKGISSELKFSSLIEAVLLAPTSMSAPNKEKASSLEKYNQYLLKTEDRQGGQPGQEAVTFLSD